MIRGLNLGGWLVLEKWMTPSLFDGYEALDEYHLLLALKDKAYDVVKTHRDTFITESDFKWIHEHGINTIRIPVGHWLFDATDPYINAESYLDFAFEMCLKYDLKILIDVHAAKGCQNGFDNGGLSGVMHWHKDPNNIEHTIHFIEKLCQKYQHHQALFGIELLNEPHWDIPLDIIKDFYIKAYHKVREYLPEHYIVIHDAFRLNQWKDFMQDKRFNNVILDTHMYNVFSEEDSNRSIYEQIQYICAKRLEEIKEMKNYFPIIVGEWSLALHENTLKLLFDNTQLDAAYRAFGSSELLTYEQSLGWFFWSYKLGENSFGNEIGWNFRKCVGNNYLPQKY